MNENISNKRIVLFIVRGLGIGRDYEGNGFLQAEMPVFKKLISDFPTTSLKISPTNQTADNFFALGGKENNLSQILAENNQPQLKITDSESLGYLTYFFNGKKKEKLKFENVINIANSPEIFFEKNPTGDIKKITAELIKAIESKKYPFILSAFSEIDLAAHSGQIEIAVKAMEEADKNIEKIAKACLTDENNYLIITSDHGNVEEMIDMQMETENKKHTESPVPFVLINKNLEGKNLGWPEVPNNDLSLVSPFGEIAQVAPTILGLLNLGKTEKSLLEIY